MIFLKTLQLNNFLSHENTTINFVEGEKTLLDGASGAGKSSIFDAILWALYGQGRADNRSLVRKGAKKGSVVLELARDDKDVVIITRTATSGGKHTLELAIRKPDGTTAAYPLSGLRELQTFIDKELIGASYLLFINSVAYVQGNSESFVAQTAPKRKELLLEIIKAEDYDKYYEQARRTLSDLENARSRALGQVSELESRLTSLKDNLDVREPLLKTINDRTQLLEEIEPKIIELENQKATFLSISQTIKVLKDTFRITLNDKDILGTTLASKMFRVSDNPQILCIKNKYPEIVKDIEKTTAKLVELRKNLADISVQEVKRNEYYAKKPNINNYNFQNIERTQEKIDKIKAQPVCPSGIDCPYSGDHTKEIEDLKTQISELNKTIALETSAMVVWSEGAKQLPPAIDLQSLMKEIGDVEYYIKILEIEAEIPPLEKDLAEKEERLKELGKQIKEVEETGDTRAGLHVSS